MLLAKVFNSETNEAKQHLDKPKYLLIKFSCFAYIGICVVLSNVLKNVIRVEGGSKLKLIFLQSCILLWMSYEQ